MIKNISISTFVNIVFALAFTSIFITFAMFINYDKQKHEISLQNRYELIAENFLSTFQNQPSFETLLALYKKFQVAPIEDRDKKLEIIKSAQELTITQNYLGTYRVYRYDDIYYIYVQQYGYNLMLKDSTNHNYSMAFIIVGFAISLFTFLFLYEILKRKLHPLKILNKQIIEFSNGNKDIKLNYTNNDEIGTIAKNFNEAINIINNQSKSKELFMRNMMHELKTPITKAMFIAETLNDENKKDTLQRAFKRMDDIIKELATVEKLTSNEKYIELLDSIIEINKRFYSNKRNESLVISVTTGVILNVEELIRRKIPDNEKLGLFDCLKKIKPDSHLLTPLKNKIGEFDKGDTFFIKLHDIIDTEKETLEKYLMIYYHIRNYMSHCIVDIEKLFYEKDRKIITNVLNSITLILYYSEREN